MDILSLFFILYFYCNLLKNILYFGNYFIMYILNFILLIKEINERELYWKFFFKLILKYLKSRFIGLKLNFLV